jgi:rRNA-processing protein FCF1
MIELLKSHQHMCMYIAANDDYRLKRALRVQKVKDIFYKTCGLY